VEGIRWELSEVAWDDVLKVLRGAASIYSVALEAEEGEGHGVSCLSQADGFHHVEVRMKAAVGIADAFAVRSAQKGVRLIGWPYDFHNAVAMLVGWLSGIEPHVTEGLCNEGKSGFWLEEKSARMLALSSL
jgi:hypothetical protein